MNSRERILRAINHEPVDRVPVDFGGTRQSGIAVTAYARLRQHLRLSSSHPPRVFDVYQMLAEVEADVAQRCGADCVGLYRPAVAFGIRTTGGWKPFTLFDGTRVDVPDEFNPVTEPTGDLAILRDGQPIARMPNGGFYFDRTETHPGAQHVDVASYAPPRLTTEELDHYAVMSRRLHEGTDKAIVAPLGPPHELFYGLGQGDFSAWMVTFATEPDYVHALYDKLVDVWLQNLSDLHTAVGNRIQVLQFCDDFGTQHAPFLSTPMFRELLLPAYRRGLDWIHRHTNWKVLLHSDGAIFPLIPALIEMGVDILNPVQTTATGMDPTRLKDAFGDKLVFWGGACDCQGTLTTATPAEVSTEVRRNLDVFMRDRTGFVCASVHNIQANVPPENILALFEAAQAWKG
ncbi:MAG: uroporphyrinogen decarboxylase family protein [Lentisphaerae bacterium]|nr:uroporphyrinogen decarboxylase family protein [Lentisphaerota bacterium]